MSRFGRPLLAAIAVLTGLTGAIAVSTPSMAAPSAARSGYVTSAAAPVALAGSAAPKPPAGAMRLGLVSPAARISLEVTLGVRDQSALTAFLAGLSDQNSPLFDHFLRPGQFGAMFGPTLAQVAAVENALRSAGLSPGPVSSDRIAIPVTATAAAIDRAFGIELVSYRLPGGRVAYANSAAPRLPAAVAPLVTGVLGLDNLYQQQSLIGWPSGPSAPSASRAAALRGRLARTAPDTAGPKACAAAAALNSFGTLTANQLASHYLMSPLYSMGDLGQGERIALVEFEPNLPSDISAYESCYHIGTAVDYFKVLGGAGSGPGQGEAALDIEDAAGLAPRATIDVYQAPNSASGSFDDWKAIVNADRDPVVSTSWGICEAYTTGSAVASLQTLFEQANAQGQTVFAATGDTGSTGCLSSGGPAQSALSVQNPADEPYVNAVGGTTIGSSAETVWNDSSTQEGAGSGGVSQYFCMPAYQYKTAIPGLVNRDSKASSSCAKATKGRLLRQVPDVSADADPNSGYAIYYSGQWLPVGGTSAAAPLWAAVAALTDASPFCGAYGSRRAGVLPEGLYAAVALDHAYIYPTRRNQVPEVLADITRGNNDYTPSGYAGGLYPAGTGFDMASGLGVPLVTGITGALRTSTFYPGLSALMCRTYGPRLRKTAVTAISPSVGPAGRAAAVTVRGSGFLPIAGADMAVVGTTLIPASCPTTTSCRVTLPARPAGTTLNIQISAEDFTPSAISARDRYAYVGAPAVSVVSPARGPARGGNRVTIRGSNFVAVRAVRFGGRLATHVTVVSRTELVVTAPAGRGVVHVTVTAVGGTSSSVSAASRYTYT